MARHDEVGGANRNRVEPCLDELDAALEPWPRLDERLVQLRRRGRQRLVCHQGARRRVVEDQQHLGEQSVSPTQVDDAPAAEEAADAPRHLPGFVEFLAGQAARVTDSPGHPVEKRGAGKPVEIAVSQPASR